MCYVVLKITGYPRLCNITLLGTTREGTLNETKTDHNKKYIHSSLEYKSVTVNYTVSNISPQLNYIFIADILDYYDMSKTRNESFFSEFLIKVNTFITNIATYHVQGFTLQYYPYNGSVVVECRFAERSTADGCHVIFSESSEGTLKSINITKSSIEESRVYQYISLPVSGNYTVTAHDIVDGTIITNPSVVYPQVLEYILLLPSPTKTTITTNRLSLYTMLYNTLLVVTSSDKMITDISSTTTYTTNTAISISIISSKQ